MKAQKNLVLCFDGTSNEFRANTKDTNIVKLHNMLERSHDRQMTYYQRKLFRSRCCIIMLMFVAGIGTYTIAEGVSKSLYSKMKHWISKGVDLMFANTFDAHVTAGYRFLMQYYSHGDRIYIFGFSRGAYAARFLARMVTHVGLLPAGNQEMVRFAYKAYQNYVLDVEGAKDYMIEFRNAFCRDCHAEERSRLAEDGGTKVYFLGLFDTVSSVRYLERPFITKKRKIQKDQSTAEHIRHAVAVDERRVKFKPALLARAKGPAGYEEDTKEVWFPGNHGDVGGGWPAQQKKTPWYKRLFNWGAGTGGGVSTDKSKDAFQLSDIALQWMIDELDNLPNANGIEWNETKQKYLDRFKDHHNEALKSRMHDVMALNGGSSPLAVIMWNILGKPVSHSTRVFANESRSHTVAFQILEAD